MDQGQPPRHNNQWTEGRQNWQITPMPAFMTGAAGVIPMRATLDPNAGTEVVLYVLDPTPFIFEIAALRPFTLNPKTGLVRTRGGPLMFLLWWLSSPQGDEPFVMFETTLNPHEEVVIIRDGAEVAKLARTGAKQWPC